VVNVCDLEGLIGAKRVNKDHSLRAGMTASRLGPPWARHPGSNRSLEDEGGVIGPEIRG
jgi:hypothetical protein